MFRGRHRLLLGARTAVAMIVAATRGLANSPLRARG